MLFKSLKLHILPDLLRIIDFESHVNTVKSKSAFICSFTHPFFSIMYSTRGYRAAGGNPVTSPPVDNLQL